MRNIGLCVVAVLVGTAAMPSLARKVKVQPAKPTQQAVVEVDSLLPNARKLYDCFFMEAAYQHAMGNLAAAFDLFEQARHIDPKAAEVYFYLSIYQNLLKNDSLALAYMQKAIELAPDNQVYAEHLAQYYIGKQQYDKATDAYEKLYAHNHGKTDALRILAQLYQQQKKYPMLLNTISRLENEEGESEQYTLSKMRVYELMDDQKAAYNELKSLVDEHPLDMAYKTMLGNWLMQHNRQKEAYKLFTEVLKEEPDNSYAQMSLYDYYKATNQESLAQQSLNQILMSKKTDLETKVMMFRSYIQENEAHGGDSTKVVTLFDQVMDAQPSADIAELRAAYMSLKNMPTDTICDAYRRVLRLAPDNASARMQLIQNLWNKKDYDGVIDESKSAHAYNPEEMVFYYFGGMAYYQKDDKEAALHEFRLGVAQVNSQSSPELVSDLYMIMGDLLHQLGDKKEAFAAYDSCLQWKDDNAAALNNYAYYLSEMGTDLHRAEAMSYKTIKAEPNNGTYLDTYAWILFLQERYAEAKPYMDAALKNRDSTADNSVVLEHAGDIYAMNGMTDQAVEYWKQACSKEHKNAVLEWKIEHKQYVTEEALKRSSNAGKQKNRAIVRKPQNANKKNVNKKGRK